ncbi:MAG TPA: hypothetical protein DIS88_12695 [Prevotella sp.]|nr:hypothetical protein [Prevotella sp.]
METELYKGRSFSGCIKAAYLLFNTNLRSILKKMWLPSLLWAVLATGLVLIYLPDKGIHDAGMAKPWTTLLLIGCMFLGEIFADIWFMARLQCLLNGLPIRKNFKRCAILTCILLGAGILFYLLLSMGTNLYMGQMVGKSATLGKMAASSIAAVVLLIAILVAVLPFEFSFIKYLIGETSKLKDVVTQDYRKGWRHWGFLMITTFISMLILIVLSSILFIPFSIILTAQVFNQLGMLDGDPNGAPSGFFAGVIAVTVLTLFIDAFLYIWYYFVLYYAYGSIEALEKERKELKLEEQIDSKNKSITASIS